MFLRLFWKKIGHLSAHRPLTFVPLRCIQRCWAHSRHLLNWKDNMIVQVNKVLCIFTLSNLVCICEYKWGSVFFYLYAGNLVFSFVFRTFCDGWLVIKKSVDQIFFCIDTSTTPVLSLRNALTYFHFILLKIKKMHVL